MKIDISSGRFIERDQGGSLNAVDDGVRALDWNQFEAEVHAWVNRATKVGIRKDVPFLIHGHKEVEFLIAIAGSLVIGAPFVPIDTIYPEDRVEKIRISSGAEYCYMATENKFIFNPEASRKPILEKDLAYIIFTSGSTGEPKGVQIGRESVVELVKWMINCFGLGSHPIFMNQAPFSFDLSIYEIMGTLFMGGCCVMNSREMIRDTPKFLMRIRERNVNTWVSTPSFAHQQLLSKEFNSEFLPEIKTFLFCGEPLSHVLAKQLRKKFPSAKILNTYGPTEATVATTWLEINDDIINLHNPLPVGFSKPDSEVFIDPLNDEICISGDHVMRGYLNRDDLNSQKLFIYNGKRAFRTGDIGSVNSDNLIFCKGRMDDQIKMNGFRVELADIEAAFLRLHGVSGAAVIGLRRADGQVGRLVAFVVVNERVDLTLGEEFKKICKNDLIELIPAYMVPSEIVFVSSLPLTQNHKVDKKQLTALYQDGNLN